MFKLHTCAMAPMRDAGASGLAMSAFTSGYDASSMNGTTMTPLVKNRATSATFEMAKMTGLVLFAQIASVLCNVMLVGFCVLAVWTLFSRSKGADGKLNFGGDNVRLTLLLLGSCVVLTLVSLLFA